MKSFALLTVLASIAAQAAASLTINTPSSIVQCEPVLLSWSDGTAPYYPSILPGGQTTGTLRSFSATSDTSLTWNCDIAAGTSITLALRDSTGAEVFSDAVTISSSSDSSCLSSNSATVTIASDTTSAPTGATSGTSTGTSSKASTSTATSTKSGSTSGTSTATSSASSGSSSSGAIRMSANAVGIAGLLGIVGAALL